jgi:polysaccharide export outer membrane protein
MYKSLSKTIAVAILALFTSCVTQKQMTYLSNANADIADSINAHYNAIVEPVIRPGDALTIFVSALDKEAVAPYNMPTVVYSKPGQVDVETTPSIQYYTVDEAGDIHFPVLGTLHVSGLKRNEIENMIKEQLEKQVLNPMVTVSLVGARVAVMGEVNRPGYVGISRRLTILEALAAAGDMTPYGKRDNVLVTREVNGKLEMARVDVRSADLYTSPYYFLQQNDVIYVSPNRVRAISSANAGLWFSMVSSLASAATVIVTVINTSRTSK